MSKAIGMMELLSISRGIYVADQMLKTSEVEIITAGSTCPGKYIAIVHGDVASVEDAVAVGIHEGAEHVIDSIVIPNIDSQIFSAIVGATMPESIQALGILESFDLATMIISADAILKAAELEPIELRLGNGLGGKSFFVFTGDVAAVETGIQAGLGVAKEHGPIVNVEMIPSPSKSLLTSIL
ncbi:microcompartments protein [Alkaliphilus metalliredigens QYMF]|uniref:Microcompartments protein n=1 Tax=Alkaliphilus metalliredigens (strain QYMF) TaxID=293826 RepID=A6TUS6_ALKMQ|nr:BMC domain-containing protein [Alkaliphilus metalliredigens]ABR49944.1 microcompartments protein [Alkaliphilus metalliredigens QYMF]